jgi:hypothetical protein
MRTLDRWVIYVGVWVILVLVAVSVFRSKKVEFVPTGGGRMSESNPVVTPSIDANSNPQSCYVDKAWPSVPASNTAATVDWQAAAGDARVYYISFTGTNPLLKNDGSGPATMPIAVSSSGTREGPFLISSSARTACTSVAIASGCYYSYDMSLTNVGAPPPTCVQHYGGGPGYDMGIHLTK